MRKHTKPDRQLSEVARWHLLSGQPDNVTDTGEVVSAETGRRLQSEKELLRAAITRLGGRELPARVRTKARLAASYLVAGDVETARRYVNAAHALLAEDTDALASSTATPTGQ